MDSYRKTAIIVGVLFIIATVTSLISGTLVESVIEGTEDLANVTANENEMIIAAILLIALAISVVLIPAFLFPILKKQDEGMALGYFGLRIIEALTPIVDAICILLLITLSQEYVSAGSPASSHYLTSGALLISTREWAFLLNPIVFSLGALVLYYLLYHSKLIPRWLSVWGLLAALLVLIAGLGGMFGNFLIVLAFPILVQEMVMAVWFIVKGFNLQNIKG